MDLSPYVQAAELALIYAALMISSMVWVSCIHVWRVR
jgi:hypothetical protein